MAQPLFPQQVLLSDSDTEHWIALETYIPKGAILICKMLLIVNYFAVDEVKNLICRVLIEAEAILFCVYAESRVI